MGEFFKLRFIMKRDLFYIKDIDFILYGCFKMILFCFGVVLFVKNYRIGFEYYDVDV